MPELPEVETVVRTLEHKINKRIIKEVNVLWKKLIEYPDPDSFSALLKDQQFVSFSRRGKFLIFELTDFIMVAHLRMEGKFYVYPEHTEPLKHTHIVFVLDEGELHYNDVRKFGRFDLYRKDEPLECLESLGYEPFDERLNGSLLKEYCRRKKMPIKTQLLDQGMIAGIGNIYANEICFDVKLNPQHPACYISEVKWDEIIESTRKILAEAIQAGGTTIRSYTSSLGVTGMFQQNLHVHSRNNELCECGTIIKKIFVNGRGTYYCPNCQKQNALLVGITGKIGSGKSTVTEMVKEAGYPVISCDKVNAELWQKPDVLNEIERITGKKTKKEVSSVIYNDSNIKRNLENYLHKLIWEEVESYYKVNKYAKIVAVEVPLLFETDWYRHFDCNVLVTSNDSTVISRLQETRNMTLEEAETVLSNQMSDEEKKKLADIIIDNNSTVEKLRENVNRKFADIINSIPED
ncbi:MAG: bifunctional DNA-formamidopyrimidine glycosylase/DNA-(apurinic or apyrimidinic site) lyase [Erysipelotrichaceae bacterium]|nr:bifunctional DNA-formamidopyrimidine glycosylase/DNA-(apurinic or apyrimidinic site) lyase [Erysipelotrichaceae bacterium]